MSSTPEPGKPAWLFIGTQPSSGSTLLADLLTSVPGFGRIETRAEGQWLTPELFDGQHRWNPDAPANLEQVKTIWLEAAEARAKDASVIVEKSPPNLCRMRRLMEAFSDTPHSLVQLTRHPLALCASWARRYSPEVVQANWLPEGEDEFPDAAAYFRRLGTICGERYEMLEVLRGASDLRITYEDLVRDPVSAVRAVTGLFGEAGLDADVQLETADITDKNRALINALSQETKAWITEGLAPFAAPIEGFGYSIEKPM